MALGVLALAAAIGVGALAWRDGKTGAALIVVAVFGTAGVICLRRARASIHRMDLRRGTLTIQTMPVIAVGARTSETTTYPLSDLMDLTLEEMSPDDDGRHTRTYRPVYVFRNGLRVPLRPNYTAFKDWQEALQVTVRAVLADAAAQRQRS